ncbi:MAG: hypothetical protein AAF682_10810 [Planctomycetota bacterium]
MKRPQPAPCVPRRARLLFPLLLPLFADAAASQWREVEPPTVTRVTALSTPAGGAPFFASLDTAAKVSVAGAGSAKSGDEGTSWRRGHASRHPLLIDVEQHPSDPQTLWGANGGVWRTTDGGRSWSAVYWGMNAVERVAVDPGDPNRVYGVGFVVVPGDSFHHSLDGGVTWSGSEPVFFVEHQDVLVVPAMPLGVVILASKNGVHRSTDGGVSFQSVLAGVDGLRLARAAQSPSVVWLVAEGVPGATGATELWRSLDGGASWSPAGAPAGTIADIAPHPSDPSRATVVAEEGAFFTVDGGLSWTPAAGLSPIANLTSIAPSAQTATTLLAGGIGGHGGIWRSLDAGASWAPANDGLWTAIPDLRFDGAGRAYALGLGVPVRRAAASSWAALDYADGLDSTVADLASDPGDPARIAWVHRTPQWWLHDRLIVSDDDGATWTDVTPPGADTSTYEVRTVAFAPDGTLYAGGQFGSLFRSPDLGQTWLRTDAPWGYVRQLTVDPNDPERLHATDTGSYYTSPDLGRHWAAHRGPSINWYPDDFTAVAATPGLLYALSGNPEKALYRSTSGGASWTASGAGLPASGLKRLAVDPNDSARLLVGTEGLGVHLSLDGGATFAPSGAGAEGVVATALAFDPSSPGRALLSAADGRLFERDY